MLNMVEFKKKFIDCCKDELFAAGASEYEIEERSVNKAQRGELNGLLFRKPGSGCAPTIYVEDYYGLYRHGSPVGKLSHDAVRSVIDSYPQGELLAGRRPCIDQSDGWLNVCLLSRKRNRSLLKTVPHKDLGCGLVLVCYWVFGEFRAMITNEILKDTGLKRGRLFIDALNSMSAREPAVMFRLTDAAADPMHIRRNLLEDPSEEAFAGEDRAFVVINEPLYRGACALFYPGVIDKIHALLNDDFYILPSSVHEMIIVAAKGADPVALTGILRSANREVLSEDDVLDDDIFICRAGKISRVTYGGVIPGQMPC